VTAPPKPPRLADACRHLASAPDVKAIVAEASP